MITTESHINVFITVQANVYGYTSYRYIMRLGEVRSIGSLS